MGYLNDNEWDDYNRLLAAEAAKPVADTSAVGNRCRYRGVDGTNFEGVVQSIEVDEDASIWGERILMDDGTPRQVLYSGLIWIDTIPHKPEPATKPVAKKAATTTTKKAAAA